MRDLNTLLKRALFKLSPRTAERLNIEFRLRAPNRDFLEESVFGYLNELSAESDHDIKTLFVGLDKHNWHYPRLLRCQFHSMDIEARMAVYGQPDRHWTGCATRMAEHYGPNAFDVVVANGLVGYGINSADIPLGPNPRTCFWGGWGGSLVVCDLDARLCISFVMNRMGEGTVGDDRGIGIVFAAYEALAA